jgi:uncharacterized integral membrane protein
MGIFILLLAAVAVIGGRFQTIRGVEYDMWLTAIIYPTGIAIAGAVIGLVAPWVSRAWHGGITGFIAATPIFTLFTMAADPRGPDAYSVHWGMALFLAAILGIPVGSALVGSQLVARKGAKRRIRSA